MATSIAQSHSAAYNEPARAQSLFPSYVNEGGFEIVRLIKTYYDYLNSIDGSSYALNKLLENHDVDLAEDKYLDAIQLHIAKTVPNSIAMDRRRLYKIIAQYYKTRGSEESIYTFFKIFFNEFVKIFYPSTQLFESSTDKSETSTRFRLQDNYYWQKYSYVIKTTNDPTLWKDSFLKFVHPAGLKLLIDVLIVSLADNTWEGPISKFIQNIDSVDADQYWANIKIEEIIGKHSPKWQPNTAYEIDYLFKSIIDSAYSYRTHTYSIPGVDNDQRYACILKLLFEFLLYNHGASAIFRKDYQSWLKYFDTVKISDGYASYTIDEAADAYLPINNARFESIATSVKPKDPAFGDSYVQEEPPAEANWETAAVTEIEEIDTSNEKIYTSAEAILFTNDGLTNNEIRIIAKKPGLSGNDIRISFINSDEFALNISGNDIQLQIIQNVTTAQAAIDKINDDASDLVTAENYNGSNGNGLVTAFSNEISLSGGTEEIDSNIVMLRRHRPAFIPEADDILFS